MRLSTMLTLTRIPGQGLLIYINKKEIEDAAYMPINKMIPVPNDMYLLI